MTAPIVPSQVSRTGTPSREFTIRTASVICSRASVGHPFCGIIPQYSANWESAAWQKAGSFVAMVNQSFLSLVMNDGDIIRTFATHPSEEVSRPRILWRIFLKGPYRDNGKASRTDAEP